MAASRIASASAAATVSRGEPIARGLGGGRVAEAGSAVCRCDIGRPIIVQQGDVLAGGIARLGQGAITRRRSAARALWRFAAQQYGPPRTSGWRGDTVNVKGSQRWD